MFHLIAVFLDGSGFDMHKQMRVTWSARGRVCPSSKVCAVQCLPKPLSLQRALTQGGLLVERAALDQALFGETPNMV